MGGLGVVHFSVTEEVKEELGFRLSLIALMDAINVKYTKDKICPWVFLKLKANLENVRKERDHDDL